MSELLKVIEIALIASVKFLFSPFEAERQGFSFLESFIITTLGGITGVLIFTFLGDLILMAWRFAMNGLFRRSQKNKKPKRKFTWRNKFIVRTKRRFGLLGIAFITPAIISIPIGTFLANRFFRNKRQTLLYIITSLLLWSIALNLIAHSLQLSERI